MQGQEAVLHGHRILVIEDDAELFLEYNKMLRGAGVGVVVLAASAEAAAKVIAAHCISVAMLDIEMGDQVWAIARLLADNGVPFALCTRQVDSSAIPRDWASRPVLAKPTNPEQATAALAALLAGRPCPTEPDCSTSSRSTSTCNSAVAPVSAPDAGSRKGTRPHS